MHPARAGTATIESACRAAHVADRYVSPFFCRRRLSACRGALDADVRGLARIAAAFGVSNADAARCEAKRRLGRGGEPRYRRALEQCVRLFGSAQGAFAAAEAALVDRRYAAAREVLLGIPDAGHECGAAFAGVAASPLSNYTVDNQQIARTCLAITGLINIK